MSTHYEHKLHRTHPIRFTGEAQSIKITNLIDVDHNAMSMFKRFVRQQLLIIVLYFFVALLIVGHNPIRLLHNFIGSGTGDTYEMARNVWWFAYALRHGEPLFYQSLLAYPTGFDGTVLITVPLQYFPMWGLALLLPLPVAYNLVVLLWMALNGWAMSWLVRDLLNDKQLVPALIAGLVYMAFPTFQGHLAEGHAGLMVAWPVPLYIWAVLHLINAKAQRWRWLLLSVLFFWLSTTGHILQSIYVLLPLTGTLLLVQLVQQRWQAAFRIMGMGLLASFVLLIALFPAISEAVSNHTYTEIRGYVRFSADALSIVSPSFLHPVFDNILDYPRRVLGVNLAEGSAYIGMLAALLAITGFFKHHASRWWLVLGFVAWLLALGPVLKVFDVPLQVSVGEYQTLIALPFALIQNLPGFNLARTPGRFNFTLAIAVAVLAGYGAAWLWQQRQHNPHLWHYGLVAVLATGIIWEYQAYWPYPLRPAAIPQAIRDLREDESIRAVFNIPYQHTLAAKDAGYLQTAHHKPLIAGQITRTTPVRPAKLAILQRTLNPALLDAAGVDIVLVHRGRAREIAALVELETRAVAQLGAPLYEDEQIAIYRVPAPDESVSEFVAEPQEGRTSDEIALHFYMPQAGWVNLQGTLQAANRTVDLLLNDVPVHRWQLVASEAISQSVATLQPGYYTLRFALSPPCPPHFDPALRCADLHYAVHLAPHTVQMSDFTFFEDGIVLQDSDALVSDETIEVRLHWIFDSPRADSDVRFIHIVDANQNIVTQQDVSLGIFEAGTQWAELITFNTDELPTGTYEVRAGWYDFNTGDNYTSNRQPAAFIATIEVP